MLASRSRNVDARTASIGSIAHASQPQSSPRVRLVRAIADSVGSFAFTARLAFAALLAAPAIALAAADLLVTTFDDSADPVAATTTFQYVIQIDNNGADPAANVVATTVVPVGATFVSASNGGCSLVAPNVVCNLGTVGAAATVNYTITLRVTAGGGSALNSTTTVTTSTSDSNPGNDSQSETTTITAGADLAVTKAPTAPTVIAGQNVTYNLNVSNLGPDSATSVQIQDTLPPNVTWNNVSPAGWSCTASGSPQVVTCTRSAALAAGINETIQLTAQVLTSTSGTITNAVSISAATPDGLTLNNTATADVTVTPGTDLRMTKSVSANPLASGQAMSFTLQPRNAGPQTAADVTVSDTLPAGFTGISASGTNWSCAVAGSTVTCTRTSMPVGATDNITVNATAPAVVPAGGTSFTNTATIGSSTTGESSPGNNSGSVNFTVLPDGADLRITKTKTPNPVAEGANMTSTIRVINNGPQIATVGAGTPIRVTDTLSGGEAFVATAGAYGTGWSCSVAGAVVTCEYTGGNVTVGGQTPALTITTQATSSGTMSNTACTGATASSAHTPADPNNTNDCTAPVNVTATAPAASADLQIIKTIPDGADSPLAATDTQLGYRLELRNNTAGVTASSVTVTDTLPMYLSGTTVTIDTTNAPSGTSCTRSGATVTCTIASFAPTSAPHPYVTITLTRPMSSGSFTNTASINSADNGDPDRTNNSSAVTSTVDPVADLELVSKVVTSASGVGQARAGTNATYVLTFRNNGPSAAQNVRLTDVFTIPVGDSGFTFASVTTNKSGGSCTQTAPVITSAQNGGAAFTCSLGTVNSGAAFTVTAVIRPNFQTGNPVRTFTNRARVESIVSGLTPATHDNIDTVGTDVNNEKGASLTVQDAAVDLLVNKTDAPALGFGPDPLGFDPVTSSNNRITYRVRITNNGPSLATGVTFTDTYTPPAGRRFQLACDRAAVGDPCAPAGAICAPAPQSATYSAAQTFNCTVPSSIAAGSSYDRFLTFEILDSPSGSGETYSNSATAASNEPDTNGANNTASESTTVRAQADLEVVSKTASLSPVNLNQPFNFVIDVRNNGPGNAPQAIVTDTLPTGVTLNGAITTTRGTCSTAGATITCDLSAGGAGAFNNGQTATITVPVRVTTYPGSGSIDNTATISPNNTAVDSNSGNNSKTRNVPVQRSSIAGFVYRDLNDNGAQLGAGETGIAGSQIRISGTDAYGSDIQTFLGGLAAATRTTDGAGAYSFTNLPPGTYTITQIAQPAGMADGRETAGTAGGNAGNAGPGTEAITAIALPANTAATGYLFGEIPGPSATLSGYVYNDVNNDGVRQVGEPIITGATVTLTGTNELSQSVNLTTTTDGTGRYEFTGLRGANGSGYTITETQPAGYLEGRATTGTGVTGAAGTTSANGNVISGVGLAITDTAVNYNFGELRPSSLAGKVYLDQDANNAFTAGEPGVQGVTVTLSGADDRGALTPIVATTNGQGDYSFPNLRPGTYVITETQPAILTDAAETLGTVGGVPTGAIAGNDQFNNITLTQNQNGIDYNFGERGNVLGGRVYVDVNGNGQYDPGEYGIAGVTVTLSGPVARTATTAADGSYQFLGVPAGTYTITETQPAAYADGADRAGTGGGSVANDVISSIVVAGNANLTGYDFGERGGRVRGFVYTDNNANRIKEANERGIPGVTLNLAGTDINGNAVVRPAVVSAADGSYSFAGLPLPNAAGYTVTETQPAGYDSISESAGSTGGSTSANVISAIPLPQAGAESLNNNFGERFQNPAQLSGRVWHDTNHDRLDNDGPTSGQAGWIVELIQSRAGACDESNVTVFATTTTDSSGNYQFSGLIPDTYEIRFREPTSRAIYGYPVASRGTVGACGSIHSVVIAAGDNVANENLPLDPNGVVYDSGTRQPVAGAQVSISGPPGFAPATHLVGGTGNATQTTGSSGFYQFLLLPGAPAGTYTLNVTPPGGYLPTPSTVIPPCTNVLTVNALPNPALVQTGATAPAQSIATHTPGACPLNSAGLAGSANTTQYFFQFVLAPGAANVVNNHLPLDASAPNTLTIRKTVDRPEVELGDSVRYTIEVRNPGPGPALNSRIEDRLPAGFRYIASTTTLNGTRVNDPAGGVGPALSFAVGTLLPNTTYTLTYRVRVGVGALEGDGVNRAYVTGSGVTSPTVTARVRVRGGVFANEGCVVGKIYVDCNANAIQDDGELGIPGVRLYFEDGTFLISDSEGKYSICGIRPQTHVLKVDPQTLPPGSRLGTTSNRNAGDAGSLFIDLKAGSLHRGDFREQSCSPRVREEVERRKAAGEVNSPTIPAERRNRPAREFRSGDCRQVPGADGVSRRLECGGKR